MYAFSAKKKEFYKSKISHKISVFFFINMHIYIWCLSQLLEYLYCYKRHLCRLKLGSSHNKIKNAMKSPSRPYNIKNKNATVIQFTWICVAERCIFVARADQCQGRTFANSYWRSLLFCKVGILYAPMEYGTEKYKTICRLFT